MKSTNLIAYSDDAVRLAVHRAVALETSRGWRIAKEKQSHKIDVVIALEQAALGAVQGGQCAAVEPSAVNLASSSCTPIDWNTLRGGPGWLDRW